MKSVDFRNISTAKLPLPRQLSIIDKICDTLHNNYGVILECDTGFGKTYMALYTALLSGLCTIIICPNSKIVPQWRNELISMMPHYEDRICTMDVVRPEDEYGELIHRAKFLIIRKDLIDRIELSILKRFQLVIVDEIHMGVNKSTISGMLKCTGGIRMIGCTATMSDECKIVYNVFCAGKNIITAKLDRPFNVYFVDLNISCDEQKYLYERRRARGKSTSVLIEYGKVESVLNSSDVITERIANHYLSICKNRKTIIVCKHIRKCKALGRLLERNYPYDIHPKAKSVVTYLIEKRLTHDGYAPILIGTYLKIGPGFDLANSGVGYDKLYDTLLVCDSMATFNNVWQLTGRILRTTKVTPEVLWYYCPMQIFANHIKSAESELSKKLKSCDDGFVSHVRPYNNDPIIVTDKNYDCSYNVDIFGDCNEGLSYKGFLDYVYDYIDDNELDIDDIFEEFLGGVSIRCKCSKTLKTCIVKYIEKFVKNNYKQHE